MAPKTSRRVAASKRKKSPARKGRKSSATKRASGATTRSASTSRRKTVSAETFVRCIRTLHDMDLVQPLVKSAKRAKLTLTMDAAAFERVKKSVNKLRQPSAASANGDPFDFGSNAAGGLGGVKPLPGDDPFDF
jgi:hypothetical protein